MLRVLEVVYTAVCGSRVSKNLAPGASGQNWVTRTFTFADAESPWAFWTV